VTRKLKKAHQGSPATRGGPALQHGLLEKQKRTIKKKTKKNIDTKEVGKHVEHHLLGFPAILPKKKIRRGGRTVNETGTETGG